MDLKEQSIIKVQSVVRRWLVCRKLGLCSHRLRKLNVHINFKVPKTQYDYYKENGASPEILQYVSLNGKTFGEKFMEQLAREFLKIKPKKSGSTYDHAIVIKVGDRVIEIHIEQKSARYHSNGDDWKWQHIEMKHKWDYLLLVGLDFKAIKFYIAPRATVEKLIEKQIITGQGKKVNGVAQPQQAYWFSRSDFKKHNESFEDYFKEVCSEQDLVKFLKRTVS